MKPKTTSGHLQILEVLPPPLHKMDRWLLWKESPHPKTPGKTRKTPYYISGSIRRGILDTEADLQQLGSLDEALTELEKGGYAGVGFALSGDGVGAFDLDWILDGQGQLLDNHEGYDLAIRAEIAGCYMEKSPSGFGLRIVGPCTNTTAYSKNGLEYWGARRFVTLTGDLWANPQGWISLDDLREPFGPGANPQKTAEEADEAGLVGLVTPRVIDELRDALTSISSDERELWIRMGMALKTIGPKGKVLWLEWSAKSSAFDEADAEHVWEGLDPKRTNYKAVFAEALREWGWKNLNRKKTQQDEEDASPESSDAFEVALGENLLRPSEFILDGFLPVGVSVIAGAWGAGKSVNLIPLLCSAAHLSPAGWGFRPALRRKVIWVSEAPEQVIDTLFSLAREEGAAPWEEIGEWFKLFRARRRTPQRIARLLAEMISDLTYQLDNGYEVRPVIVLDTTSANIEIENESDNSLVSQAMAILKQSLPGVSLILVGHTPKALVKADVGDMTFRGAGAWEADAVATYFLIYDEDTDSRFLALRKCRFNPDYREISFSSMGGSQIIDTPWGEPQSKSFMHGVPARSTGEQRKAAKAQVREEQKEETREKALSDRQRRILDFVDQEVEAGRAITKAIIQRGIGGKRELAVEAITRLLDSGRLVAHSWDTRLGQNHSGEPRPLILPEGVDLGAYLEGVFTRSQEKGTG